MTSLPFADRRAAGRALGERLRHVTERGEVVVLGLPRGGLPVAAEVARALGAPLDVLVVRKIGVPWQPELAMGAVASGDVRVLNEDILRGLSVSDDQLAAVTAREHQVVRSREQEYRGGREPLPVEGRVAVVVDDGVATGATAQAAAQAVRARGPASVVLAIPVGAPDTIRRLEQVSDEVVYLAAPPHFLSVGQHYRDFTTVTDAQVRAVLTHPEPA